jgi:hypothetical protein
VKGVQVLTFHGFYGGVLIVGKILVSARLTCLLKLLTCKVDMFFHIVYEAAAAAAMGGREKMAGRGKPSMAKTARE